MAIVSVWCICHRIHRVARNVTDAFPHRLCRFRKLYKRVEKLKEMQPFCDTAEHRLLKPSGTRWLAMQQISSRLCEQWDASKAHFNSEPMYWVYTEDGKRKKVEKLQREKVQKVGKMLDDDVLRLSYMFLRDRDNLPIFI